jgi:DNA-binding transcriptional MerR regulator
MRQNSKVEGTKIAQAAKDLNVTSVTIRRYLIEFNIPTTSDENGIKVLPAQAMEELKEVRRLKEDGLTNPKVLEFLEELRSKGPEDSGKADKPRAKKLSKSASKEREEEKEEEQEEEAPAAKKSSDRDPLPKGADKRRPARGAKVAKEQEDEESEPAEAQESEGEIEAAGGHENDEGGEGAESQGEDGGGEGSSDGRSKHSLTCQTCSKVFEHMNPRLRDCLDCYRTKRKERRRGGSDRHKNVIQHPLAQQAASKQPGQQQQNGSANREGRDGRDREPREGREPRENREHREPREAREPKEPREREFAESTQSYATAAPAVTPYQAPVIQRGQVRNYRKAIEETRQVTGSLKRRLERPDLPEGERRWLEQIYAYQLILHQGWRHLAEYKSAGVSQGKPDLD